MFAEVEVVAEGGAPLVVARGELDLASAPQLRSALMRATADDPSRLVVDLTGVTFVDSTGIGVIIGTMRRGERRDRDLRIRGASPGVRRILEIAGLTALLEP